jgi:hypothetical protein
VLPGGGLKTYRNQPGSRLQTFWRNPQNLVLSHIKPEQGKDKPLPLQWTLQKRAKIKMIKRPLELVRGNFP